MISGRLCIALLLPWLLTEAAAQTTSQLKPRLPQVEQGDRLPDIARRLDQYYATYGTERGSGFKQTMRGLDFIGPRYFPTGEFVNITALTWLNHYRMTRSPEFAAARQAAAAAGIGNGNWRAVTPLVDDKFGGDIGRVNALAFHPTDPQTIYAGTPAAGLWRTQDGGANWRTLTDALPMIGVTDIAIDPANPQTLYILTGDGEGGDIMHGPPSIGVLKSVDGGQTWAPTGLVWKSHERRYGNRLAISAKAPNVLLVGATTGLYRTADGGESWKRAFAAEANNRVWDILFHPVDPSVVYMATRTEVYRSEDAGETWKPLAGGLPVNEARTDSTRIRLAVTPAKPDTLYVLYGSVWGFTLGLYRSDDRGETFNKRSSTVRPPGLGFGTPNVLHEFNNFNGNQTDYDLAMAASPVNADLVHVGGLDIWRSDDGGRTWRQTSNWRDTPYSTGFTHADIHVLAYRGGALFAGTDGGVFRSDDDGGEWSSIATVRSGFVVTQIYGMCVTPQDPNMILYGTQDNGTFLLRTDGELTQVLGGDGMQCQIDPKDSKTVYGSYYYGEIYRSDDGGQSFQERVTPLVDGEPLRGAWVTPYVLGVEDSRQIYACYDDLWFSPDRGATWKNLTNGALGPSKQCAQAAIAPSDPKTIYVAKQASRASWHEEHRAGDPRPPFLGGGGVFRTTDGGATWRLISGGLPIREAAVTSVAVSPTDADRAWISFSGYKPNLKTFETKDGGKTWSNISEGLPNLPANALAAQAAASNGVYVGLDAGVYYRDDRLARWVPFADGLPHVVVKQLVIDEARKRIFAATFARGIWVSDLPSPCVSSDCAKPPHIAPASAPPAYAGPIDLLE